MIKKQQTKKKQAQDVMSHDQKEQLAKAIPAAQFIRNEAVWRTYMKSKPASADVNTQKVSEKRKDVMSRLFLLMQNEKLECKDKMGNITKFKDAASDEGELNLASLLSHGGRSLVILPPIKPGDDPNKLFNWVTGGADNLSRAKSGQTAEKQGCPIFQRFAATHSVNIDEKNEVHEIKVKSSLKSVPRFAKDYLNARHWGMNLGLREPDKAGEENGSYGHLYLFWQPPTLNKPGVLMFGCEGCAPGVGSYLGTTHDTSGRPNQFSPTGALKFTDKQFDGFQLKPDSMNGISLKLNAQDINQLVNLKASEFKPEQLSQKAGGATSYSNALSAQSVKSNRSVSAPPLRPVSPPPSVPKPSPDSLLPIPGILPPLPDKPELNGQNGRVPHPRSASTPVIPPSHKNSTLTMGEVFAAHRRTSVKTALQQDLGSATVKETMSLPVVADNQEKAAAHKTVEAPKKRLTDIELPPLPPLPVGRKNNGR
jgi:hypothetical protein